MNKKVSLGDRLLYGWFASVQNPTARNLLAAAAWTITLVNIFKLVEDVQDISCQL